jgi:hypothetical protein
MEIIQEYIAKCGTYAGESLATCSSGEIQDEKGIKLWKQKELNLAYSSKFPHLRLSCGTWTLDLRIAKQIPVPLTSQDVLSNKG